MGCEDSLPRTNPPVIILTFHEDGDNGDDADDADDEEK